VIFSCLCDDQPIARVMTGQNAGFDFGLQTFLMGHDGAQFSAPNRFARPLAYARAIGR
jgi:hypothetical protein